MRMKNRMENESVNTRSLCRRDRRHTDRNLFRMNVRADVVTRADPDHRFLQDIGVSKITNHKIRGTDRLEEHDLLTSSDQCPHRSIGCCKRTYDCLTGLP